MAKDRSRTELFLKIIAWLAIIFGAFGALGGLFGCLTLLSGTVGEAFAKMPNADPQWVAAMQQQMKVQAIFGLCLLPLKIAAIAAGIAILQKRSWGRTCMEALAWISIVTTLASVTYTLLGVDLSSIFAAGKPANAGIAQGMGMFMKGATLFMGLLWCALFAATGWFLRRKETRRCFGKA
jgi:hypothetical protein